MTYLTQAIETVQLLVPPDETPWQASWIPDEVQTAIFWAVASGDLIPLADHKLAVALMVEKAVEAVNKAREKPIHSARAQYIYGVREGHNRAEDALRALAPDDALAEVQALLAENEQFQVMAAEEQRARKAAEAELAATQAKLADAVGALHDAYNHQLAAGAELEAEMAKARSVEKYKRLAARYAGHYSAMNDLAKRIAALEGAKP